ncbi:MAG: GNAT family N-acetyltransferase [Dehalococcoidia bacterium]
MTSSDGAQTSKIIIRHPVPDDRDWVDQLMTEEFGAPSVVGHEVLYTPGDLPGFMAVRDGERVGLLTYQISGTDWEIVTFNSRPVGQGTGTLLLEAVVEAARQERCRRLWLMTANDNLRALRFYQRRGFMLRAVYPGAVAYARERKPEIPLLGDHGIPILDEIELEMPL